MYAVIKTGGKQYRVSKDDVVTIERVSGDAGAKVEFDQVLMVGSGADVKHRRADRFGCQGHRGARRAIARTEAHRFQKAPPQKFAPQEGPQSGPFDRAHHRHHRRVTSRRFIRGF